MKEPTHLERLFGSVPKLQSVVSGTDIDHTQNQDLVVGSPEMKATARRIRYLLAATGKEPSQNKSPNSVAVKVTIAVGDQKVRLKNKFTKEILRSISFKFDDFSANEELAFALLKRPGKRAPCARCQVSGHSFFTCRVVKAHSNPDFDFLGNWIECGGVEGLLSTFSKASFTQVPVVPEPVEQPAPNAASTLDEAETNVSPNNAEEQEPNASVSGRQTDMNVSASGPELENLTVTPTAEPMNANDNGDGGNVTSREEEVVAVEDPSDSLARAQEMLQKAKKLQLLSERLSKEPLRLGKRFIDRNFPIDPSDGRYIWCTVCGLSGDVLCCDGCANVVHPACVGLDEVPDGDWFCNECVVRRRKEQLSGSTNIDATESLKPSEPSVETNEPVMPSEPEIDALGDDDVDNQIEALEKLIDELDTTRNPSNQPTQKSKILIGTEFYKVFPGAGRFRGTVQSLPSEDMPYFRVEYEDGDVEDMDEDEILQLLEQGPIVDEPPEPPIKQRGRPKKDPLQVQDEELDTLKRQKSSPPESPARDTRSRAGRISESGAPSTSRPRNAPRDRSQAPNLKVAQGSATASPVRKGWSDEENDLFFDGITKFKAGKTRDDRWSKVADTITTKTTKQVFDQLYWFFHGSRGNAYRAYQERKKLARVNSSTKQKKTTFLGVGRSNSSHSRRSRDHRSDDQRSDESDDGSDDEVSQRPRRRAPVTLRRSDNKSNDRDDDSRSRGGRKVETNQGKWTDSENDLFFDGIERFNATSTRGDAWDKIIRSIETRPDKQVRDQLYAYFKGYRDRAFRDFCERRGFLTVAPPSRHEERTSESDDETPPPSKQKRRGPVSVFRVNPLPHRGRCRSPSSAASSLSDEDWDAPSQQQKRGRGRPRGAVSALGRTRDDRSEAPISSAVIPNTEVRTSTSKSVQTKPDRPVMRTTDTATSQRSLRKRTRSESPVPGATDPSTHRIRQSKRR